MEQLVARRAHNPKVVGSSPAPATFFKKSKVFSRESKDFFRLEQLVARRAHIRLKADVGSSPAPATFFKMKALNRKI